MRYFGRLIPHFSSDCVEPVSVSLACHAFLDNPSEASAKELVMPSGKLTVLSARGLCEAEILAYTIIFESKLGKQRIEKDEQMQRMAKVLQNLECTVT